MISVIVIGRNEGPRLSACIDSIRTAMGMLSHEIIYVDSRSSDDSIARAAASGARCLIVEDAHPTAGLGRFIGAQHAKGEYLLFLDGDMQLRPGFVSAAMMAMLRGSYAGAVGIRDDVYLRGDTVIGRCENYFGCTSERIAPEFGGALFIKAEALSACGGWSPDTIACEEAELHARLRACGLHIVELPIPMILHTDAVRDNRGIAGTVFSRRRLGEGQALRCAAAAGKARAYLLFEREKFALYLWDLLCLLLPFLLGGIGVALLCFVQAAQAGYFFSRRRIRAFVSQKLFFFAFPMGLFTYRRRSRTAKAV